MARGTIIVPTTHPASGDAIEHVRSVLIETVGGYSEYEGRGGWHNGESRIEEEHVRFVVSDENPDRIADALDQSADTVKLFTDEEAVFTEIVDSEVRMR